MQSEIKWLHNKKKPSLDLRFRYTLPANHRTQIPLLLLHTPHNAQLQRETVAGLLTQTQRTDVAICFSLVFNLLLAKASVIQSIDLDLLISHSLQYSQEQQNT